MKKLKFTLIVALLLSLVGTTAYFAKPIWNRPTRPVSSAASQPAPVNANAPTPQAPPAAIAGVWNEQGKPHLDLQLDEQGKVTGTVVWWDGPNGNRVPVETGTFDRNTGVLRLEGNGPVLAGAPTRYIITGTLENDTLSGEYAIGPRKGNFAFTR